MRRNGKAGLAAAGAVLVAAASAGAEGALVGRIAELAPLLGTWEVEAQWSGGGRTWARTTWSPGLAGRSIEARVLVQDDDAPPYVRYFSVFRHDAGRDAWIAHTFHHDGNTAETEFTIEDGTIVTEWREGSTRIRDRTTMPRDGRMRWTVAIAAPDDEGYTTILDAEWIRRGGNGMPRPIDSNLFAAGETTGFTAEAVIHAPVERVWKAWTDGAAFAAAYDPARPELKANLELAIGGRYEWLWDGEVGSNGCQVLSFVPNRMITFSWNAPPDQARSRAQRTWVVVELEPADDGATRVLLTHHGFGEEPHWQETKAYFEKAWPHVLERFRRGLEGESGRRG